MRLLVVLLAVLLTGCAARTTTVGRVPSGGVLKISVSPVFLMAGKSIMLTWRIERELEPREFCVEIVGFRRFCEQNPSRRIYQQLVEGVPEGKWTVVLAVLSANGQSRVATTEFCVSGLEVTCGGPD
jgi:hypothetical protein